jgi:transcriptional regulator with XRE-family HTH domain
MTTLALPDILTDLLKKEPIPKDTIAYLVARTKLRLHDFILRRLAAAEDSQKLDQAKIARRLGVTRAQISQLLGVPGNWTVASVTKLAAAMGGEIEFQWKPFQVSPEERSQSFQAPSPEQFALLRPDEKDAA